MEYEEEAEDPPLNIQPRELKPRWVVTAHQLEVLESTYQKGQTLSAHGGSKKLAQNVMGGEADFDSVTEKQILNWFKNRQARDRKKGTGGTGTGGSILRGSQASAENVPQTSRQLAQPSASASGQAVLRELPRQASQAQAGTEPLQGAAVLQTQVPVAETAGPSQSEQQESDEPRAVGRRGLGASHRSCRSRQAERNPRLPQGKEIIDRPLVRLLFQVARV